MVTQRPKGSTRRQERENQTNLSRDSGMVYNQPSINGCLSTIVSPIYCSDDDIIRRLTPDNTKPLQCLTPDISERGLTAEGVDVDGEVAGMVKTHAKSVSPCVTTPQKIKPNPSFCVVSAFMSMVEQARKAGIPFVPDFCCGSSKSDGMPVLV